MAHSKSSLASRSGSAENAPAQAVGASPSGATQPPSRLLDTLDEYARARLLEAAAENAGESILITDAQLDHPGPRIVYVNPAFTAMTGYTSDEVLGKTPRLLQGPETDRAVAERLRDELSRGERFSGKMINYRKNGEPFVMAWHTTPITDAAGEVTHYVAIQRDVTEDERAHEAMAEAQATLAAQRERLVTANVGLRSEIEQHQRTTRALARNQSLLSDAERLAHLGSWGFDTGSKVMLWSDEMYRMYDLDPDTFTPAWHSLRERAHPEDQQRVERNMRHVLEDGTPYVDEWRIVQPSGVVRTLSCRAEAYRHAEDGTLRIIGTNHDVTDQRRLEHDLLRISEEERQRLGREIHDGLGQIIAGASYLSGSLLQRLTTEGLTAHAARAEEVTGLLEEIMERARSLSHLLLPPELAEKGLKAALEHLGKQVRTAYDVPCTVSVDLPAGVLGQSLELHLYRIAQEAVANAARHSQASSIRITLHAEPDEYVLCIADDGIGIPSEALRERSGIGLRTMRYRAHLFGADLFIKSEHDGGTTVCCHVPLNASTRLVTHRQSVSQDRPPTSWNA